MQAKSGKLHGMDTRIDIMDPNADLSQLNHEDLLVVSQQMQRQLAWMFDQLKSSNRKLYGPSSEKTIDPNQLSFFNEVEAVAVEQQPEPQEADVTKPRKKQPGKREQDLAAFPLEVVEHDVPVTDQVCPKCSGSLHRMSKEERTELVFIPAQFKKVKHVRWIYACRNCEQNDITTPIIRADAPAPLIKGSIASAELVAGIINGKYVNALPLYRQEKEFERLHAYLPRQNMANWVIRCAQDYLAPLYERMRKELLKKDVAHADETTTQVLKEPGRKPTTQSYMWLYRTGRCDQPIVLFDYQQTRAGKHPEQFLRDFKGYLHTDGYACYHNLPSTITIVGCFAHVRRKFEEALKIMQPQDRAGTRAEAGLAYCNALFKWEQKWAALSSTERYTLRLEHSQPVLDAFHHWLIETRSLVAPKSKIGNAVNYTLGQWPYLVNYMLDGRLEISNNAALSSSSGNPHHSPDMRCC
jgi:transposase